MQKQYKAWICDFDGTVVGKGWSLSPTVKEAIEKLISKGIIFSLATGRPYQGIIQTNCKNLNFKKPQITNGGARIVDPKTDKSLWTQCISTQAAKTIIEYLLEQDIFLGAETENGIYTKNAQTIIEYGPQKTFENVNHINFSEVLKIVAKTNPSQVDTTLKTITSSFNNIHIIKGKSPTHEHFVLDITSERATKHMAVLKLSEILGIHPNEMVGVGDGYNDYPLLTACGYKIAMGHAPEELKAIANLVVSDINHNGLAEAISQITPN